MNRKSSKLISALLCLALLVSSVSLITHSTKAAEAETDITRSEWLQALTKTFDMSVESDSYPDNYFSDLSSDSDYYYDMLLAVEFGLVDVPAGGELRPNDPVTREFAAQTMNYCLGYQLDEGAEYTFSEAGTVACPDDIQVALNRGWFTTENGAALPEQAITTDEMALILADAKEVLDKQNNTVVDEAYEFADGVVVIPQGTVAYENEQGQIVLEYSDVVPQVGDIFAVTTEIFPQTYTADQVATEENVTTVTVTEVPLEDYLLSISSQGTAESDLENITPAEGVDTVYILEDNTRTRAVLADKTKKVKEVDFYENIGGVEIDVQLTKMYLDYYVKAEGSYFSFLVKLRGDVHSSCTVPFGGSVSDFSDALDLCSVPIAGIGSLSVSMDISLDGAVTAVYDGKFLGGVAYDSISGFRLLRDFQKKSFTIFAQATLDTSISVGLSAKIPFASAACTATLGTKINMKLVHRDADCTPRTCIHTDAWVYAKLRCYASVGYKDLSERISKTITFIDRNNSPIRSITHYEDGAIVDKCTVDTDGTTFGRYYTSSGSRYRNGGVAEVNNSPVFTYTLNEDGEATITGYSGNTSALAVPSSIDGHTVVAIGNNACKNRTGLVSVSLPATVRTIGANAFYGCTSLCSISLSEGITTIGSYAFENCTNLRTLRMPDTVTTVYGRAFSNCSTLSHVDLSNCLEFLGSQAFYNCDALTSIEIPKSLNESAYSGGYNGCGPFHSCDGLKTVTFEEGTTKIPVYLFANCPGIEEIILPETLTKIESYSFYNCKNLKEIDLPDTVSVIGHDVFFDCTSLTTVKWPNSLTKIPDSTFYGCTSLTDLTLPENLTHIGEYGFNKCTSLTEIVLPSALKKLGEGCFKGSTALACVTFPDGLTTIGDHCFSGCTALTEVVLPDSVTSVGAHCFYNCDSLKSVTMSNNVSTLGADCFHHCEVLETVVLSSGLNSIPARAFKLCPSLTEIVIPRYVTTIATEAFNACTKLAKVIIPREVESIGNNAFSYPDIMTVYGVAGTYAETWANSNDFPFVDHQVAATSVVIDKTLEMNNKTSHRLTLTVDPADFTDIISWKSTNTSVITVDERGTVTAKSAGTAKIKVVVGNRSAVCTVTVLQPVTSISLNYRTLTMEALDTKTMKASVYPGNATNSAVVWSSSNEMIATVDQNGIVTALRKGTAVITATAADGSGVTASCTVTVKNSAYLVENVEDFQSTHNYENSCTDFWVYKAQYAAAVQITFDEQTNLEEEFDYLYIYDGNDTLIGEYTGTALAGTTLEIPGDTVIIRLISDDSGTEWGFAVTEIKPIPPTPVTAINVHGNALTETTTLTFTIDSRSNEFQWMYAAAYSTSTGRMLSLGIVWYDGEAETLEIELPGLLPEEYTIRTFYVGSTFLPIYRSDAFSSIDLT